MSPKYGIRVETGIYRLASGGYRVRWGKSCQKRVRTIKEARKVRRQQLHKPKTTLRRRTLARNDWYSTDDLKDIELVKEQLAEARKHATKVEHEGRTYTLLRLPDAPPPLGMERWRWTWGRKLNDARSS